MKMQITVSTTSTKTLEINLPKFWDCMGIKTAATEKGLFQVTDAFIAIVPPTDKRFGQYIDEAMCLGAPITQQHFEAVFLNTIKCLREQYLAFTNMNTNQLDPGTKQEEVKEEMQEQATEATQETTSEPAEETDAKEGE